MEKDILIKILEVKLLDFSFKHFDSLEETIKNSLLYNEEPYLYETKLKIYVDTENALNIVIDCEVYGDEKKIELISASVLSKYNVKNIEELIDDDDEIDFPDNLVYRIANISVGNFRGAFSLKAMEAGYKNMILPLIDARVYFDTNKNKQT